jgi:hypothetical protein
MAYINIRDVDPQTHAVLSERARLAHLSLTAYIRRLLEREAAAPDPSEIFARAAERGSRSTATFEDKQAALDEVRGR